MPAFAHLLLWRVRVCKYTGAGSCMHLYTGGAIMHAYIHTCGRYAQIHMCRGVCAHMQGEYAHTCVWGCTYTYIGSKLTCTSVGDVFTSHLGERVHTHTHTHTHSCLYGLWRRHTHIHTYTLLPIWVVVQTHIHIPAYQVGSTEDNHSSNINHS